MSIDTPTPKWRNVAVPLARGAIVGLLAMWGISKLRDAGAMDAMGTSEQVAAAVGLTLLIFAFFCVVQFANAYLRPHVLDTEAADTLREGGRMMLYGYLATAAIGLVLILLSLAGPGGLLSPAAALTGAMALLAVITMLSIVQWRLMDELLRTLSHETGNLAFYLIFLVGGGWTILAHLGFAIGPAPIDWLTIFALLSFTAAFIAMGRRGLLTKRSAHRAGVRVR